MGYIDFKHEKELLSHIRKILLRRDLVPDTKSEWEIHGPHPGMDYQVYVGYALPKDERGACQYSDCNLPWKKCKRHVNFYCVAIYPKAVYEIEEPSDWGSARSENRIPILK